MTPATSGRFWAIGVGPGDPELLTLKAVRILNQVQVIYHAGPEPRRGRAWEIVARHLRPDQESRIVLTAAMSTVSTSDWRGHYRPAVEQIAADCRAGRDVAFIAEGDPTLYSTAAHVWQLLAELFPEVPIEVVPGVTSITAAAARLAWPLAQKDEPLVVLPAGYHAADLRRWLDDAPNVCLMKPTAALSELTHILKEGSAPRDAVYVENLGRAEEWLTHDLDSAADRRCYFSLVVVKRHADDSDSLLARRASEGLQQPSPARRAGRVSVVGLGPGAVDMLTVRAVQTLRQADVIVGYDAYLQSLAALRLRAEMRGSPIGAEADRARQALELAQHGRNVALVSSGDAGVYGMASLLVESAEALPDLEIEISPGVTAALASAALLGAPLGHDFACISLSDLLTPWETIERRLEAAGRGDFVLALYNPVSQRRTWQLPRAREILLRHRGEQTPVGIVDRAYRSECKTRLTTLSELTADGIGMETLLIVGSSQTRTVNGRMVTPRGYSQGAHAPRSGEIHADSPGRRIMGESFAIIERELGAHELPPWAFAVLRRMIHASADFEFTQTLRYSPDFESACRAALARERALIVTDTEMVMHGIVGARHQRPGLTVACLLNDAETTRLAAADGLTRSAAGIRVAARRHAAPILAIGNAPTALDEALRLIDEEGWRPAALVGMPVGFVGVTEAKARLLAQSRVPYLTCVGRKGGSAVTAAAVNALIELETQR
jgi:precorrin-2 C(20)-methyltransferase